jgi:transcriptional regulator of acetoin/glycerol metabolism
MLLEPKDLGLEAVTTGDAGALKYFDFSGTLSEAAQRALRFVERQKIVEALAATNGNKMLAAEDLGVSYKTLLTKIKDYDLA